MECQATRFPSLAQAGLGNSKVGLAEALQELREGPTAGEVWVVATDHSWHTVVMPTRS